MTILPIVQRELRVAARKRVTYWNRVVVGLIAIIAGTFAFIAARHATSEEKGLAVFIGLSIPAGFYCLFAGNLFTVDCLTEEKREGTLGLLFLTDLKGVDVILGKLAATSLNALFGLLALLPILAIPIMMGGTSNGQFWRMALVLVTAFLFSLAIAIYASAACRTNQRARLLSVGLLLLFTVVIPAIPLIALQMQPRYISPAHLPFPLFYSSPIFCIILAFDSAYRTHVADFWYTILIIQSLTWWLVYRAARIVPHSWQERQSSLPKIAPARVLQRSIDFEEAASRVSHRKRLLDINAYYWLAARNRFKPAMVWGFLALIIVGYVLGAAHFGRYWFNPPIAIFTALLLNSTIKIWLASEAGTRLAEDKKSGALELVLSTPMTAKKIIGGQWLALRRQFLRPVIVIAALQFVVVYFSRSYTREFEDFPPLLPMIISGLLLLVADACALGSVAIQHALLVRKPPEAGGAAVLRILVFPWVVLIIVAVILGIQAEFVHRDPPGFQFYWGLWCVLSLITDLRYGLAARHQLRTRFHELATAPYSESRWRR